MCFPKASNVRVCVQARRCFDACRETAPMCAAAASVEENAQRRYGAGGRDFLERVEKSNLHICSNRLEQPDVAA